MRKFFCLFFILILVLFSAANAEQVPGQIIVRFKPGVISLPRGLRAAAVSAANIKASSVNALNSQNGVFRVKQLYAKILEIKPEWTDLADYYILEFPKDKKPSEVATSYINDSNVVGAQPNSILRAFALYPNDPGYLNGDQWSLTKISAPQAWGRTTGSTSVMIAVLDTGVNYNHEDLQGQVASAEGYDFVNNDADPMDDNVSDYHGTTVAGVIGAATNNAKGIAGVDWQAKILPVKVLDSGGFGAMSDILQGIAWARAKGAKVINMSFGQYIPDTALQQACQDAYNDGIVSVAAAGNGNTDQPSYPAYFTSVVAVGASNTLDARSIWSGTDPYTGRTQASNYGSWVDVCAPGTLILSTFGSNHYVATSGTSIASPMVAGLAGLIRAVNPAFTNQQIIDTITHEADFISTDQPIGKRINAYLAIRGVEAAITAPVAGTYVKGVVSVVGSAIGWDFNGYRLVALQGSSEVSTIEVGTTPVSSGQLGSWNTTALNGACTIKLQVFSAGGITEEVAVNVIANNTTPEASVSYPTSNLSLSGKVSVLGIAKDPYFDYYVLEYGVGSSPVTFQNITTAYNSVNAGRLVTWETTGLNGQYTIRLSTYNKAGTVTRQSVIVNLSNTGPEEKRVVPQPNLPLTYGLPNPFNRQTSSQSTLNYSLSSNFDTKIYLFDLGGNLVWMQTFVAGDNGGKSGANNPAWTGTEMNGNRAANGLYLYQIVADQKVLARGRIVLLN